MLSSSLQKAKETILLILLFSKDKITHKIKIVQKARVKRIIGQFKIQAANRPKETLDCHQKVDFFVPINRYVLRKEKNYFLLRS